MDLFKLFSGKPSSKEVAKDRLKLILIHDRSTIAPELLDMMKSDILRVISKYVIIDDEEVEVRLTKTEEVEASSPALIASIPIKKMKQR
ncbi:cell division topological specificity factor MinE [Clostridium botulinum]|uniref:Cell division topological specificity factor n=2 Tax=Clostridium botulinum TaxID=1491 RepID=A0A9Q1UZ84_CLOBO|nr:cell division topological specificity factor MinE [Clostridium botulinum]AEB75560.1 cell division topological specificity factor MinE [Clostridium botulinum BKT015925]KEH99571.1 cell division topological specificity factor MinE [Clostridium botulinum D str. 16868]KEI03503.1 cell division topological specificity factor MinE [Clostridium botulinum C/D str. Sp77]KEI04234.1 cell division topological specificity factor MinE [Clostridium botulinum C/D str. BKT75002]KEI12228.1 cell division topolo